MKLTVIGFGQCGSMIADEFARLNRRARHQRGMNIVPDAFAVNTGVAELGTVQTIPADYRHRIIIGGGRTRGHGAANLGERGAEIAREEWDKVAAAIRETRRFAQADALLLAAATAGGTGSGAMPVMAQRIRERLWSKPVYCLAVLPFEHEEKAEARTVYNTALCLKSSFEAADAVILVDNQRFLHKDIELKYNVARINELVVEPFYNLLCAGEERKSRQVGTRVLDAADITETLSGWTAMGYGKSLLSLITLPFESSHQYRKASVSANRAVQSMDQAIAELSIDCQTQAASAALYLISAPASEMPADVHSELSSYLRSLAPEAVLRVGDYPDERGILDVVVVLSGLRDMAKVRGYYAKAAAMLQRTRRRQEESRRPDEDGSEDLPSLL
jgi:cell division GTPase FtsZ